MNDKEKETKLAKTGFYRSGKDLSKVYIPKWIWEMLLKQMPNLKIDKTRLE